MAGTGEASSKFLCSECGACCRIAGEQGFMPQRGDGACLYLTKDNLCAIYDSRPEICNVKTMYNRKIEEGKLSTEITEIDYYMMSTAYCHEMIDLLNLDEKYKIDLASYGT